MQAASGYMLHACLSPCELGSLLLFYDILSVGLFPFLRNRVRLLQSSFTTDILLIRCLCSTVSSRDVMRKPPKRSGFSPPPLWGLALTVKVHLFSLVIYFHMCAPFLLSHVFQGVKAGSTMVPVWVLTIAIMNGSERGGE